MIRVKKKTKERRNDTEKKSKGKGFGWIVSGCGKSVLMTGMIAWLFYRSVLGFICFPVCLAVVLVREKKKAMQKMTEAEQQQFCEYLGFLREALLVGYSLERAVTEAKQGMLTMYKEGTPIIQTILRMERKMQLGQPVEAVFSEWAQEAACEDIKDFSEVLYIAKRTGGAVRQVITDTEQVIRDKQETLRYIQAALHSREYESKVMKLMPFAMLFYLQLFMPDFLDPLYHNLLGIVVMSAVLITYFGLCAVVDKVTNVSV